MRSIPFNAHMVPLHFGVPGEAKSHASEHISISHVKVVYHGFERLNTSSVTK